MSWKLVLTFESDGSTSEDLFRSQVERLAREWRVRASTSAATTDDHDNSATTPPYNNGAIHPSYCTCGHASTSASCPIHSDNRTPTPTSPSAGPGGYIGGIGRRYY